MVQPLKVQPLEIEKVISSHTVQGAWLLFHAGFKILSKSGPWCSVNFYNHEDILSMITEGPHHQIFVTPVWQWRDFEYK